MKYRALVAEDDEKWQKIFRRAIEENEFVCDVVSSYPEACVALARCHYSLAILDIRLDAVDNTNEDGLIIASHLKDNDPETAIVIITGYGTMKIAREGFSDYGIVSLFDKTEWDPDNFCELSKKMVKEYLKRKEENYVDYLTPLKTAMYEKWQLEHDLYSALKPSHGSLEDIIRKSILPFYPLLPNKKRHGLYGTKSGFSGIFWSRPLGSAILIELFSKDNKPSDFLDLLKKPFSLGSSKMKYQYKKKYEDVVSRVYIRFGTISQFEFDEFISNYDFSPSK